MAFSETVGRPVPCPDETEQDFGPIFLKVQGAWEDFIAATAELAYYSPLYDQKRQELSRLIKSAIPEGCLESLTRDPKAGDPWRRFPLDVALDDLFYDLSRKYPDHVDIKRWVDDKSYWPQFVQAKRQREELEARDCLRLPSAN